MGTGSIVLEMLAALFLVSGARHLLIWSRNPVARRHGWFGLASLAASVAAAVGDPPSGADGGAFAMRALTSFCWLSWLVGVTWFAVEYAGGATRRRRRALLGVLVLAPLVAVEGIWDPSTGAGQWWSAQALSRIIGWMAVPIVLWLAFDGARWLWLRAQRGRAVVCVSAMAVASLALLQAGASHAHLTLALPALVGFLVVSLLVDWELAVRYADETLKAQRQHHELAHASRLSVVGELTTTIAHQIKQPLGAILSNVDAGEMLLERPEPPLDQLREILVDVRRDGLRAGEVIHQIRRLVRTRELELEKLDANAVVTEVIELLDPEARRRRITISGSLLPPAAYVNGDRGLLVQVLINLVLNAMDAIESIPPQDPARPERSTIQVAVREARHGLVELRVTDAGTGIPEQHLTHLFDSFYTSKAHGMGLGLSIARSITEMHGGQISARNNHEAGASFTVTLPPFDGAHD